MATGDKLVTLDGLKAVYDKVDGDVGSLKRAVTIGNNGYEYLDVTFSHGMISTASGTAGTVTVSEAYKYEAVTPNAIHYSRDVVLKVNSGYQFLVFFYDSSDVYQSRTGSWQKSTYAIASGTYFRLFVALDPQDNTANVPADVFAKNIYRVTEIAERINDLQDGETELNKKIDKANAGKEYINATFKNGRMVNNFPSAEAPYKYQVVTMETVTYSRNVTIKANPGYQFIAYWYNDSYEYVSRNGSAKTEYVMPANTHFRLFVQLSPPNSSATVSPETFKDNIYVISEMSERVGDLEHEPLTTLPAYIRNTLSCKEVGPLSKGYILLSCDDGTAGLATYTIPMLEQKEVPCTFGLFPTSDVITNETYLATLLEAIGDGCCVAMHGTGDAQWPSLSESALNTYFDTALDTFETAGIDEVHGAICPGGNGPDTSTLVKAVAGGRFGAVFSGGLQDEIKYGSYNAVGPRTNMYAMARVSAIGLTQSTYQAAIDDAYANHYILCPFWHDYTIVDSAAYQAIIEGMIDYAKTKGLTFITMKDLPYIK